MRKLFIIVLLLFVTACASSRGFDRGTLRSQISDQKVVTEKDIQKTLALKPQLPDPFKLAIYFAPPKSDRWYWRVWNWRSEDKDMFLAVANEAKSRGAISEAVIFSDDIVEGSDNRAIRMAAARVGADAVLIMRGTSDIDRYNNAWGYTYALIVTPLFIPGTEADGIFMANASMWDVRNQFLYMTAEAEGTSHQTKPAAFIEEDRLIKAAKADALAALKRELSTRLMKLVSK
ncbi:MAG TPA: hypothetical protein DCO77_10590 [Nitrospiraceae bacterium]|nr:hypothetical protein [Nitrospiraceae bacterium]